jgi:hypothetical protein
MEARMTEQEILARYSTPGLRRNVLTRAGKKAHLQTMPRITPEEIEEILNRLYPEHPPSGDSVPDLTREEAA